jgi:hypothetical protein
MASHPPILHPNASKQGVIHKKTKNFLRKYYFSRRGRGGETT